MHHVLFELMHFWQSNRTKSNIAYTYINSGHTQIYIIFVTLLILKHIKQHLSHLYIIYAITCSTLYIFMCGR